MEVQVRSVTAVLRGWMKVSVEIRDDFGSCDLVNLPGNMVVLCCSCYSWVWHLLYSTWYTLDKDATGFCLSISEWPCAISTHLHTSQHRGANAGIFQLHPTSRLRWLPNYFHKNPLFGTGRSGSLWDWGCPRGPGQNLSNHRCHRFSWTRWDLHLSEAHRVSVGACETRAWAVVGSLEGVR